MRFGAVHKYLIFALLLAVAGCGSPRYDQSLKPPPWLFLQEKEKMVEINGYQVKYSVSGEGYPVIFIPGLSGIKTKLAAYPKLVQKYQCISYNLRGLAGDKNQLAYYDIKQLSDDLATLFTKFKLGRAVLVGHSYGGCVALQFALDQPEKVAALILNGTFARFDFGFKNNILAFFVKYAPDFLYRFAVRKHVEEVVARGEPQWAYDYILACDLSVPRPTAVQRIDSLRSFDVRDKLSKIKVPTLIMVGSRDELTGIKYQIELAGQIPNSHLKVIRSVGHVVDILKPAEYEEVILAFLKDELKN